MLTRQKINHDVQVIIIPFQSSSSSSSSSSPSSSSCSSCMKNTMTAIYRMTTSTFWSYNHEHIIRRKILAKSNDWINFPEESGHAYLSNWYYPFNNLKDIKQHLNPKLWQCNSKIQLLLNQSIDQNFKKCATSPLASSSSSSFTSDFDFSDASSLSSVMFSC